MKLRFKTGAWVYAPAMAVLYFFPVAPLSADPVSVPAGFPEDGWSAVSPYFLAQARSGKSSGTGPTSHRIDLRLMGGYDDNPLKLNPTVLPTSAPSSAMGGLLAKYRLHHRSSETFSTFAEAELRSRKYIGDADAGDRHDMKISLGVTDQSMRLQSGPMHLTVGGTFGWRDMTFIDNQTGLAANGLEDRFDAIWYKGFARLRAPLSKQSTLRLDFTGRAQDYTVEYGGFESLDYTQLDFKPGIQTKTESGATLRLTGHYGFRIYSSRRADDLNGTPVDGTTLNYHFFGAKLAARKKISEPLTVRLGSGVERRVDSEVGFNNRTTFNVSGGLTYDLNPRNQIRTSLAYEYREYDNLDSVNVSTTNDGGRKRQGYRLFLTYLAKKAVMGADGYVRFQRDSFTNSDLFYEYDRNVYTAGVRARF